MWLIRLTIRLHFTGPPVPITARVHSTPQRPFPFSHRLVQFLTFSLADKIYDVGAVGRCTVDVLLEPRKKIASTFEYADKAGAQFIVFVAPDEWARGVVAVKDLRASAGAESKQ
eukprot:166064-Pyramimonas_sp.AAC.2